MPRRIIEHDDDEEVFILRIAPGHSKRVAMLDIERIWKGRSAHAQAKGQRISEALEGVRAVFQAAGSAYIMEYFDNAPESVRHITAEYGVKALQMYLDFGEDHVIQWAKEQGYEPTV